MAGGRGGGRQKRVEREMDEKRMVKKQKKHLLRSGLEMTLKSPRFKSALLFKMQKWQIEIKIKQYARQDI